MSNPNNLIRPLMVRNTTPATLTGPSGFGNQFSGEIGTLSKKRSYSDFKDGRTKYYTEYF